MKNMTNANDNKTTKVLLFFFASMIGWKKRTRREDDRDGQD